jgi:single-strand DNA-binding protein
MANINAVVIVGNLTRDAEIKFFNNGNAIVKGSIAQNRRKKQGDTWVDEAMFFDFAYGGKGAEAVHKYLTKGKMIGIQGELRQDRWEQDGQARSKVFVSAFEIQLLGGREGAAQPTRDQPQGPTDEQFQDDIPF